MNKAGECGCRICTGEMEDKPMQGMSRCPHCDVPMTYGDTHRGAVVRVDAPDADAAPTLAHRRCLGDKANCNFGVVVFPRDAVKP